MQLHGGMGGDITVWFKTMIECNEYKDMLLTNAQEVEHYDNSTLMYTTALGDLVMVSVDVLTDEVDAETPSYNFNDDGGYNYNYGGD
jgi:hypothetical protein